MEQLSGYDMVLAEAMERAQQGHRRRQGQFNAFVRAANALPVPRLVLTDLLEQDHRQRLRSSMAARDDVERRQRRGDVSHTWQQKDFHTVWINIL